MKLNPTRDGLPHAAENNWPTDESNPPSLRQRAGRRGQLKTPERGGVVLDQPQPVSDLPGLDLFQACCGWSATQPRSWFRQALSAQCGRWLLRVVQTLALMSVSSALCLGAAEPKPAAAPWVSLFNGRDLTGWKIVALTNPAPAVVEDGAMVLRQRANTMEHTFVASEREYEDFILELDLKDDPGFSSGIVLRCVESPAAAKERLNGYQVKIDNTPRAWTGGIFHYTSDAPIWLHDLADNAAGRAAFKMGEWAHLRIECIGSTIKVWVNGVPTCHLVDEIYRKGSIAFKIHSLGNDPKAGQTAIRLKNIRLLTEQPERFMRPMELPPRRAPAAPGKNDKAATKPASQP